MMIYVEMKGFPPKDYMPVPRMEAASLGLQVFGRRWAMTKPGRTYKIEGCDARLYYTDGKLAGVAWFDPVAVPKGDEPGQPKRQRRPA